MALTKGSGPYFPARPLQELLRQRLAQAEHTSEVTAQLGCNSSALSRVLKQRHVTMRVADNWAIKLGSHISLLYPDEY